MCSLYFLIHLIIIGLKFLLSLWNSFSSSTEFASNELVNDQHNRNAPVNWNHCPHLVRGSTGGGNVPCFYLPDGPAVRSECGGFVFAPKIAGIWVYTTGCGGIWRGIYQPLVPAGRDFTWDWLDRKSKSPLFPGPVVTIDSCITTIRTCTCPY